MHLVKVYRSGPLLLFRETANSVPALKDQTCTCPSHAFSILPKCRLAQKRKTSSISFRPERPKRSFANLLLVRTSAHVGFSVDSTLPCPWQGVDRIAWPLSTLSSLRFTGEAEEEASSLPLLLESAPSRPQGDDEDTTQESLLHSNAELEGTSGNDDRIDIGFDTEASGKRVTFRQQFVAVVKMRVKTYRRSGGLLFNTAGMALVSRSVTMFGDLVMTAVSESSSRQWILEHETQRTLKEALQPETTYGTGSREAMCRPDFEEKHTCCNKGQDGLYLPHLFWPETRAGL
jgi:hypothetical protein